MCDELVYFRPLEEKVALTYSIVSYYNQLAAGIQQPPPSHLNFLRLDKAPPLVTSQPQQPPPSTGTPACHDSSNIQDFLIFFCVSWNNIKTWSGLLVTHRSIPSFILSVGNKTHDGKNTRASIMFLQLWRFPITSK